MEIVPFADEHVDAAAELLAARHERDREVEPLLSADVDFRTQIESEWRVEGASGMISGNGYVFGRPWKGWFTVGIGGHALRGDAEHARDLYAAAAGRWVEEGHTKHAVFVPSHDGRSHCEEEFTPMDDIEHGANTLLGAALELAGAL